MRDSASNPVSGVTVIFTAPATGASACLGGSLTSSAVTNSSGVASVSALSANAQTGIYAVTASVSGVSTAASFALSNSSAPAGSVFASAGTLQSTTVNVAFGNRLQATVRDVNNNPLNGIAVNFTAPASGPSGAFSGSLTAAATTNSSGMRQHLCSLRMGKREATP